MLNTQLLSDLVSSVCVHFKLSVLVQLTESSFIQKTSLHLKTSEDKDMGNITLLF